MKLAVWLPATQRFSWSLVYLPFVGRSWHEKRKRDGFYKKAKREGYLSRAAYKLKEINRENTVMREGATVVDLGAAPGGWSQVAKEIVGESGKVIAVDLKRIDAEDVIAIRGDMTEDATLDEVREAADGPVDCVLSDMSPNISGNYSMDHARSVYLCESALEAARKLLRPGGGFVVKVFQGDLFKPFYDEVGRAFEYHTATSPKATRKGSSEIYVIGERFRG